MVRNIALWRLRSLAPFKIRNHVPLMKSKRWLALAVGCILTVAVSGLAQDTRSLSEQLEELAVGKTFPDFNEKDLDGNPLSVARFKGKVVLIDFWAVWCGPCIAELPHLLSTYEKHHADGFEIIGISLDRERDKLTAFLKQRDMTWPQYFDGLGWQNKLAQEYGINSIPATFLLDREGKIIAKDLRGDALETAVARALAKN